MMKKMGKKMLIYLVCAMLMLSLTACGGEQAGTDQVQKDGIYPFTVTDQAGREIVIDKRPQSLVSSYYITTSALLALGLGERMTGIESNPEKRSLYAMCAPELLQLAQVGSPKEFDVEACAALQPDLVILPMRAKDVAEPLEQLGITVMIVNPESQDEILEMLQLIGKATDSEERARELTDFIRENADHLAENMKDCEKPSIYLGGNSSFLSTAAKSMYQNELMTLAGGQNVAGEIEDTYWVESSYEQILNWNPEIIVLASEAKYSIEDILSDAALQDCRAVLDRQVYRIPSEIEAWDSPVPASFLGAYYLASVLHPDIVSEAQYEDLVKEYYERFYGFSYEKN